MIRISKIEITGISARGPFGGSFEFGPGLQVVSTPNRRGKSLAFAGTTWCLGVEQIYGVLASDNSIFPDAARSRVDLGNERAVPVSTADAHLELERDDGAQLSLSRSIVGGELNRIAYDDGVTKGVLQVGYGASKDTTADFGAS